MTSFRDEKGRSWEPRINVVTIARVRSEFDVNLLAVRFFDEASIEKLSDWVTLVAVLYLLCEDQAKEQRISQEDFGRSMNPEAIEEGWRIAKEGIVNFSPKDLRPAYRKVLQKADAYRERAAKLIEEMMENAELDAAMDAAINQHSNLRTILPNGCSGDATNSQDSSVSNREKTPSPR